MTWTTFILLLMGGWTWTAAWLFGVTYALRERLGERRAARIAVVTSLVVFVLVAYVVPGVPPVIGDVLIGPHVLLVPLLLLLAGARHRTDAERRRQEDAAP